MTSPRKRQRTRPAPPLSTDDVFAIIATRAAEIPLTTTEVTDMCQAAHPDYDGITADRVHDLLQYLVRGNRITSLHGGRDSDTLEQVGVVNPRKRWRYWMMPALAERAATLLAQGPVDVALPHARDGRQPFAVTDPFLNAPWGALLELTDSGRAGWWQHQGHEWVPVAPPWTADGKVSSQPN